MADRPDFTAQQMIDALTEARGLISFAARKLGCHSNTVRNYIARHPTVAAAVYEAREAMKDVAEAKLVQSIHEGEAWAVKYYLSTQAKDRGYVERVEQRHGGDPDNPTPIPFTFAFDRPDREEGDDGDS